MRHETQKNRCPDTLFDVHEENKRTTLKTSQATITAARASRGFFIAITIITLFLDGFCVESENYYDLAGMVRRAHDVASDYALPLDTDCVCSRLDDLGNVNRIDTLRLVDTTTWPHSHDASVDVEFVRTEKLALRRASVRNTWVDICHNTFNCRFHNPLSQ